MSLLDLLWRQRSKAPQKVHFVRRPSVCHALLLRVSHASVEHWIAKIILHTRISVHVIHRFFFILIFSKLN